MKNELITVINNIIKLLDICNMEEKVKWFQDKQNKILELSEGTSVFKNELLSIKKIIAGMGSFTDLSLIPKENSGISIKEARLKQWELAAELDQLIIEFLK